MRRTPAIFLLPLALVAVSLTLLARDPGSWGSVLRVLGNGVGAASERPADAELVPIACPLEPDPELGRPPTRVPYWFLGPPPLA